MGGNQASLDIHPNLATFAIATCRAAKGRKQTPHVLPLHLSTNPTHPRLHLARRQRTSPIPETRLALITTPPQSSPPPPPQSSSPPQTQPPALPNRPPHAQLPAHNHTVPNKRPNQSLRPPRPRNPTLSNPANPRTHKRRAKLRDLGRSLCASAQNQNQKYQHHQQSKLTTTPQETHPDQRKRCCRRGNGRHTHHVRSHHAATAKPLSQPPQPIQLTTTTTSIPPACASLRAVSAVFVFPVACIGARTQSTCTSSRHPASCCCDFDFGYYSGSGSEGEEDRWDFRKGC
jgi:hypothetical protein